MGTREEGLEEAAALLDEWAEADEGEGEEISADTLRGAAASIRALKTPAKTVKCICDLSCANRVPASWRTAMCRDCAACDCQHEMLGSDL